MAKREKKVKVKALVNLKYDSNFAKINEDFVVRESDLIEMLENGYVVALEEVELDEPGKEQDKEPGNDEE